MEPSTRSVRHTDAAAGARVSKSAEFTHWLQRNSWWILAIWLTAVLIPDLVRGEGRPWLWVFIYPGVFIALSLEPIIGRFANITLRNHPFVAVLPLTSYLVGTSILGFVLVETDGYPMRAALATLLFGIPAAGIAALVLSPGKRRAWREARDNDKKGRQAE